jgi:hypothetical protein
MTRGKIQEAKDKPAKTITGVLLVVATFKALGQQFHTDSIRSRTIKLSSQSETGSINMYNIWTLLYLNSSRALDDLYIFRALCTLSKSNNAWVTY